MVTKSGVAGIANMQDPQTIAEGAQKLNTQPAR